MPHQSGTCPEGTFLAGAAIRAHLDPVKLEIRGDFSKGESITANGQFLARSRLNRMHPGGFRYIIVFRCCSVGWPASSSPLYIVAAAAAASAAAAVTVLEAASVIAASATATTTVATMAAGQQHWQ